MLFCSRCSSALSSALLSSALCSALLCSLLCSLSGSIALIYRCFILSLPTIHLSVCFFSLHSHLIPPPLDLFVVRVVDHSLSRTLCPFTSPLSLPIRGVSLSLSSQKRKSSSVSCLCLYDSSFVLFLSLLSLISPFHPSIDHVMSVFFFVLVCFHFARRETSRLQKNFLPPPLPPLYSARH